MKPIAVAIALLLILVACGQDTAPEQAAPEPNVAEVDTDPVKEIAWFDGSVDEAFAFAKETGKPLFLY